MLLRFWPIVFVASVILGGCGGGGSTPTSPATPAAAPAAAQIDAIVESAYPNASGVEVAIFRNGTPRFERGYGLRDRGLPDTFVPVDIWGVPQPDKLFGLTRGAFEPDAATIYDLASVSKAFTAGAILLLLQDGKLALNDSVAKYFPSLPSAGSMTLLNLLQHSSGFVGYDNFGSYPDFSPAYSAFMARGQTDYQPIVDLLATFPLKFAPGTQYDYSNTNYLLLGLIVAQVSHEALGTFFAAADLRAAEHDADAARRAAAPVSDFALGYRVYNGAIVRTWQWNLQWLAGPGGMTSTVGDLDKWDRAVRAPGIFSAASLAQMFAPGPFPQPYGTYACGWFIATLQGHPFIWHDGALGGYQTLNATFPNDGLEIVILTNDGTGLDPYFIVPQLFPIALAL